MFAGEYEVEYYCLIVIYSFGAVGGFVWIGDDGLFECNLLLIVNFLYLFENMVDVIP